jgi:hypothetical protein
MSNLKKRKLVEGFEEVEEEKDQKEYVVELGKPKIQKVQAPVIPLIEQNEWNTSAVEYGLIVKNNNADQPMLAKNAPPISELLSERQKYKVDVELRPDENEVDYEKMPIEDFGSALLRGMGWKEGKPVGKNPNGIVSFLQVKPRPSLLGLGAEPEPEKEPTRKKQVLPGDVIEKPKSRPVEKEEIPLHDYKIGSSAIVIDGSKKGQRGKLVDISRKSSGIAIKIQLHNSDTIISVWEDQIEIDEPSWIRPHIRVV